MACMWDVRSIDSLLTSQKICSSAGRQWIELDLGAVDDIDSNRSGSFGHHHMTT
jgi:hypothetical protein